MRNIILPVVQTLAGSQQNLPGISCVTHNYRIVVTSFKKNPEVHNICHCRQRKTESEPRVTCTDNFVKFENAIFDLRTDRQTNRQTR